MRPSSAYHGLQRLFRLIAMVALAGLVLITAVDVIGRVLFDAPLGFAYELIGILLGLSVYSGLISVNFTDDHIRIDLLEGVWTKWPKFDALRSGFSLILEFIFFAILAAYIGRQAYSLFKWHETFLFLSVEKWVPISVFCALAIVAVFSTVLRVFPALHTPSEDAR